MLTFFRFSHLFIFSHGMFECTKFWLRFFHCQNVWHAICSTNYFLKKIVQWHHLLDKIRSLPWKTVKLGPLPIIEQKNTINCTVYILIDLTYINLYVFTIKEEVFWSFVWVKLQIPNSTNTPLQVKTLHSKSYLSKTVISQMYLMYKHKGSHCAVKKVPSVFCWCIWCFWKNITLICVNMHVTNYYRRCLRLRS